jgi:hypothetical protein
MTSDFLTQAPGPPLSDYVEVPWQSSGPGAGRSGGVQDASGTHCYIATYTGSERD